MELAGAFINHCAVVLVADGDRKPVVGKLQGACANEALLGSVKTGDDQSEAHWSRMSTDLDDLANSPAFD